MRMLLFISCNVGDCIHLFDAEIGIHIHPPPPLDAEIGIHGCLPPHPRKGGNTHKTGITNSHNMLCKCICLVC